MGAGPGNWASAWSAFRAAHSNWFSERWESDRPNCCLPGLLAAELAKPMHGSALLASKEDLAAERGFAQLCERHFACGVLHDCPIEFPLFAPATRTVPQSMLTSMTKYGWTEEQVATAAAWTSGKEQMPTDSINARLKGWLGILVSDPEFLEERDALQAAWCRLVVHAEAADDWGLPLRRTRLMPLEGPSGVPTQQPPSDAKAFLSRFDRFCDRWQLSGMATWELPLPQGPLMSALSGLHALQTPGQQHIAVVPTNLALLGQDRIAEKFVEAREAETAGETAASERLAALRHWESYGRLFEIAHYEAVVFARYGRRKGSVTQLEHALAAHLGVQVDRVGKLRKALVACRKGKRPKWLR